MMINNAILKNCKAKKKNVSTAWIDYKKAFHSVLQMPPDVQDTPGTDRTHRAKHESLEDQYDTSP